MPNLSFTTQGATPFLYPAVGGNQTTTPSGVSASNPVAKALNSAQAPNMSTLQGPRYVPPPTVPAPTTPVKSTTVNNPDGSSHTVTYHAPDTGSSSATPATTPPPTQTASAATPFSNVVGGLIGASSQGSPTAPGYIQSTANYGAGNIPIGESAADIAANYGKQIADVGRQGAKFEAGQLTTGTSPVAEGNAAVTAQTTAEQQAALAAGETAALKGTEQQLTAEQQAANAANAAAGQSLTGQGLVQSGLTSAGTLTQPSPAAYGQTVFNPATGQFAGGGGNLDPQVQAQSLAQKVMSGAQTYEQAIADLGYAGNAGRTFLDQAITGAGGDPLALQAKGAGQQNVLGSIPALQSASTAAEGISNTITSYLQQNPNLNANTATVANLAQQWAQGKQLGNPAYQTLFNDLSEYANTLAPVLGVGGDPTNMKTQIAQSFINAQASGQSITQVLQNMNKLATNKINDLQSGATGGKTTVPNTTQNASSNLFSW